METPLRQVGTSISVLTTQNIEDRGHATLVDVLRSLPGISATANGGLGKTTSLRIRGEAGYRTLVLVDGIDVSDPTGTQVGPQIQHILAADVERVEVLRGPQGMMYGADAGGVINVITRRAEEIVSGNANLEYGRYGTQRATANLRGSAEIFDYSLSVADLQSDGFSARDASIDPEQDPDGYDNTTISAQLGAQLNDEWRVELSARDVNSEAGFDNCWDSATSSYAQDCIAETEQTNYKLATKYQGDFGDHQLSFGSADIERNNFTKGVLGYATEGTTDQIQYLGAVDVSDAGKLVIGGDWQKEQVTPSGSAEISRKQLGVYAEWQGSAGEQFFYTAGFRSDDNDAFGRHNSVRLTSAYLIAVGEDELKLKASYGTGFRAPSLFEETYNKAPWGNQIQLREEQSEGFDLGVEYRAQNGAKAELVYFDQDIENEIAWAGNGYAQSTGLTRSKGIELSGSYPLVENVSLTGNYTYTDSVDAAGNQRRRVPESLYNMGLTGEWLEQALRVSANMRWVRDVTDGGTVQLDNYQVLDITATYQATEALNLYVRAENALDEEYQEINTYNASGAAFYGGVRYSF